MTDRKEILREYRDCSGLHILQEILAPNPPNGNYAPKLDELLNLSKPVLITARTFTINARNLSDCEKLQELGLVKMERKDFNKYKMTLTKAGVAWLIRDRLEQLKRFDEIDDNERIRVYLSNIKIEGDDYA